MRVISGSARGKKLKSPKDKRIRPTLDRVKESLFNILGRKVYDCRFLDLFSGSGAIGIEALSRGSSHTVFCDKDAALTRENLSSCLFDKNRYLVIESSIENCITRLSQETQGYDIIFLDPPYGFVKLEHLLKQIWQGGLLHPEGLLIVETDIRDEIPKQVAELDKIDERRYSITKLSFYQERTRDSE